MCLQLSNYFIKKPIMHLNINPNYLCSFWLPFSVKGLSCFLAFSDLPKQLYIYLNTETNMKIKHFFSIQYVGLKHLRNYNRKPRDFVRLYNLQFSNFFLRFFWRRWWNISGSFNNCLFINIKNYDIPRGRIYNTIKCFLRTCSFSKASWILPLNKQK